MNGDVTVVFQRVGVQPGRTAIRVGHKGGGPRPGRDLGDLDQAAEVLQEDPGQEGGEHQDHEGAADTGIPAVRVQQQQLAAAVQVIAPRVSRPSDRCTTHNLLSSTQRRGRVRTPCTLSVRGRDHLRPETHVAQPARLRRGDAVSARALSPAGRRLVRRVGTRHVGAVLYISLVLV